MADKGLKDKVVGGAKDIAGKLTGDKKMQSEGATQKVVGKAKEVSSDVKDKVEGAAEAVKETLEKKK